MKPNDNRKAILKADNTTPLNANEYDKKISNTLPYYQEFYTQTISVVKNMKYPQMQWLDLGCGTGTLAEKAGRVFTEAVFTMADPSKDMLEQAKEKNKYQKADYIQAGSEEIIFKDTFDVVTAIQAHHYLHEEQRHRATENVYRALHKGGVYITFENVVPEEEELKQMELHRWADYQMEHGKTKKEAMTHIDRCGTAYFPITIRQHIELLKNCGFRQVHVFWVSYMQMGVYAIK